MEGFSTNQSQFNVWGSLGRTARTKELGVKVILSALKVSITKTRVYAGCQRGKAFIKDLASQVKEPLPDMQQGATVNTFKKLGFGTEILLTGSFRGWS